VSKLLVLASGVVKAPQGGGVRGLSAYLVLSAGAKSRVFRVRGTPDAPVIEELPAATTLDVKRFQTDLQQDLQPVLDELRAQGHPVHVELSRHEWVAAIVRKHIEETEGVRVE
jgi:hypothetical protein